jgi:hypothetical protein
MKPLKYTPFLISYLKLGVLLHLITILELIFLTLLFTEADIAFWLSSGWFVFKIFLLGYIICLPIFAQLDARSRYQNYKQAKDQFYLHGFRSLILLPFLKSRCQRDAVSVAAEELGYGDAARAFFYQNGYRWYHLLPDFSFRRPQFLLTKHFWINTFFMKDYKARFNYKLIYLEQQKFDFRLREV